MSNPKKSWWTKTEEQGKSAGITLLLLGMLLLLISAAVSVFWKTYDATWLLGISIGTISIGLGFIAIGMSAGTDKYVKMMLSSLYGTIDEAISAELDLARIIKKEKLTVTGKEYRIYNSSENIGRRDTTFLFGNAWVCLDKMKEKDIVRIRLYIKEGGKKYQVSTDEENTYRGIQATAVRIDGGFYNQEGIEITAEHIVADSSPLEISCYAYDAARGS